MSGKGKPTILEGKVYIVPESDVDTDMIFHNRYLHITDPAEMGQYIFDNLPGHVDFPGIVEQGTVLITGHNFGCGSSRQQAVDGFIALGVNVIIGESFGAIYKRNVINAGLPLIECPGILKSDLNTGCSIKVNLLTGEVFADDNLVAQGKPMGKVQVDIYNAEGLLNTV